MSVIEFKPVEGAERFDTLQTDESLRAHRLAGYAAFLAGVTLEQAAPKDRLRWIAACAALLRGQHEPWRKAGYDHATDCVEAALLSGELGFALKVSPEKQRAIARKLAVLAVTVYGRTLDGTTPLQPGEYLRIVDACEGE